MNYETTSTSIGPKPSQPADTGWFSTMSVVQVFTGGFYLIICLFASFVLIREGELAPAISQPLVEGEGEFMTVKTRNFVEIALTLQLTLGGVLGIVTIFSGILTRKRKSRSTVKWISILNLLYFPVGTTVGTLVLLGLRRDSVKRGFSESS